MWWQKQNWKSNVNTCCTIICIFSSQKKSTCCTYYGHKNSISFQMFVSIVEKNPHSIWIILFQTLYKTSILIGLDASIRLLNAQTRSRLWHKLNVQRIYKNSMYNSRKHFKELYHTIQLNNRWHFMDLLRFVKSDVLQELRVRFNSGWGDPVKGSERIRLHHWCGGVAT